MLLFYVIFSINIAVYTRSLNKLVINIDES